MSAKAAHPRAKFVALDGDAEQLLSSLGLGDRAVGLLLYKARRIGSIQNTIESDLLSIRSAKSIEQTSTAASSSGFSEFTKSRQVPAAATACSGTNTEHDKGDGLCCRDHSILRENINGLLLQPHREGRRRDHSMGYAHPKGGLQHTEPS